MCRRELRQYKERAFAGCGRDDTDEAPRQRSGAHDGLASPWENDSLTPDDIFGTDRGLELAVLRL